MLAKLSETFPDAHGVQIEEPKPEKVPARHGEHNDDPEVKVYMPAGQYLQLLGLFDVTYVPSIPQTSNPIIVEE